MIRQSYLHLLRYGPIRRVLRRVRASLQSVAGYSDPFFDLAYIARQSKARLFLDIGCHRGDALLRFIESGVACPVAAFDPFDDNIRRAKAQLQNYPQVAFYQIALSNTDGIATFYLNRNEQTSSLLPNDTGNQESFPTDTSRLDSCEVKTSTLDYWAAEHGAEGPCIIKCDTQGAEGLVIQGGKEFILKHCAAFYGEFMLGDKYKGQCSFVEIRE
jgi:FkbM family methyltransferase